MANSKESKGHSPEVSVPLSIHFQNTFQAINEPLPEPGLGIGLGYKGPKEDLGVEPSLTAMFRGDLIQAFAAARVDGNEIRKIIGLAIETAESGTDKCREIIASVSPGRKLVDVLVSPAAAPQVFLMDEEQILTLFEADLSPADTRTNWSLTICPPKGVTPPRESLSLVFPDWRIREEDDLWVPVASYRQEGDQTIFQNQAAKEYREKLKAFAGILTRELGPLLAYWQEQEGRRNGRNDYQSEFLRKAYAEASATLKQVRELPSL
jgi:hypothetical protein